MGSRAVVVLFGDSLTQRGYYTDGWAAAVSNYYGRRADVLNRGYGGYNTRYGRHIVHALFPDNLKSISISKEGKYLLATVWFGANDASTPDFRAHVPLPEFESNMEDIISHLQNYFHFVVALSLPPVHAPTRLAFQRVKFDDKATGDTKQSTERAGEYSKVVQKVAQKFNAIFVDVHNLMLAQGDNLWPAFVGAGTPDGDGLHLSKKGEQFVSKHVIDAIEKNTLKIQDLPAEFPWGSQLSGDTYVTDFAQHQVTNEQSKIGLGSNYIKPVVRSDLQLQSPTVQFLSIVLLSVVALFFILQCITRRKSLDRSTRSAQR